MVTVAPVLIPVDLPAEACDIALGLDLPGASLHSGSLATIKRASTHPLGGSYRKVMCAIAEAQELLHYFQSTTHILAALKDVRAEACCVAADNLRLVLRLAGVPPLSLNSDVGGVWLSPHAG
jgi:hypothetical protein